MLHQQHLVLLNSPLHLVTTEWMAPLSKNLLFHSPAGLEPEDQLGKLIESSSPLQSNPISVITPIASSVSLFDQSTAEDNVVSDDPPAYN